jgi:hypothetical protein
VNAPATLLLLLCAGCVLDLTEPTPLAGPPPAAVVVAPLRQPAEGPQAPAGLLEGVDAALRARGYRVLPLGVGSAALREKGLLQSGDPDENELFAVRRALDVDAVLLVTVHSFATQGSQPLDSAEWDLDYRLVSAVTGDALWEQEVRGRYRRPPPPQVDPNIDPWAEPLVQPFGGHGPDQFRDAGELMRGLHRAAFDHLPKR